MAISVPNTIPDLVFKARHLGILDSIQGSKRDGSYSKEDLIIPIRQKLLQDKYGSDIPDYLNLIQEIKSPMLSKRIDELNQDFQDEIWSDDNWDLEEKINGVRCIIIKDSSGIHFFSRSNSRDDLLPIQMPVYINNIDISSIQEDFILDCEIESLNPETCMFMSSHGVVSDSNTQAIELLLTSMNPILAIRIQKEHDFQYVFNVFDCLYYNSIWVMNQTLQIRRELVSKVCQVLSGSGLNTRTVNHSNIDKKGFFNRCLASGYEGCVAKRLDSIYIPDTKRNMKGWIKIKRPKEVKKPVLADLSDFSKGGILSQVKASDIKISKGLETSFGDTVDAFISGFTTGERGSLAEGKIQSLDLSVWILNKSLNQYEQKSLGSISYMDYQIRDQITSIVNGLPTLNPVCYNAVVELDSLCNMILNFRYDKKAQDCIMEQETYNQIMCGKQ